jgi:hypothetical protein
VGNKRAKSTSSGRAGSASAKSGSKGSHARAGQSNTARETEQRAARKRSTPPARTGRQSSKSERDEQRTASASERNAKNVGGSLDFGIPAARAAGPRRGGRGKGPEQGTGSQRASGRGVRETGVGWSEGSPGSGSGGDLDPDVVGVGSGRGLAAGPAGRTTGPDMVPAEEGNNAFASGPRARGERPAPRAKPTRGAKRSRGDTVDHGGGDASTTGPESGADQSLRPTAYPAPPADGDNANDEAARRRRSP